MSKLKNIKAINQMLAGEHRYQTRKSVGFSDIDYQKEKNKERQVGDIWEEINAKGETVCWWEQKDGYRLKYNVNPQISREFQKIKQELNSFKNCPHDECKCKKPNQLDEKFRRLMGMCHECVIDYETKLKINGKFNDYAREKMRQNALGWFKQADVEVEVIKKNIEDGISYVAGADGIVERWETENKEALLNRIDEDYNRFKEQILEKFK